MVRSGYFRRTTVTNRSLAALGGTLVLVSLPVPASAQTNTPRPRNTYVYRDVAAPTPPSVDVHPDGRITFRISANNATDVSVRIAGVAHPMTSGPEGAWTTTVGPFEPEIYEYWFTVHSAKVL